MTGTVVVVVPMVSMVVPMVTVVMPVVSMVVPVVRVVMPVRAVRVAGGAFGVIVVVVDTHERAA